MTLTYPASFGVPWSALAVLDGKPAVWTASPEVMKAELKPVTVIRYTDELILISDGLSEGDLVIGAGSNMLYPGRPVRAAEAD